MLGGAGSRDARDPRELRLPHLQDDRIQLAFPPKAQVDDQQGSDSAIPNYLFFFFTLDPVALIISYLGLQSNLK